MPSRLFKEGVYKILITMEQYEVKTTWALGGGKLFRAGEYVLGHILPPGETIRGGGGRYTVTPALHKTTRCCYY